MQSVGFTLGELKEVLREYTEKTLATTRALAIIHEKMREIERKKVEFEQIQNTLKILKHKIALKSEASK
ncbi:MerR family DNA-binding protein [Alicyclobacillus mengziensis]|uniref:MerR family DNA-binding protein n=1 Tax=Alicyclobacillus mengziensis TaxID=2931921 RepID=UPI003D17D067